MRSILEELPHALLPDPERESDDPGVARDRLDDDLVRPAVEEQLARSASRGQRSPLARHVVHTISPLDPALPLTLGVRLHVEGIRVTDAAFEAGFTHQALERRAVGLDVDDPAVWALVARAAPAPMPQLALALALERLAGPGAPERARVLRGVVVDLLVAREALALLASPPLLAPRLARTATSALRHVEALLMGITEGGTLTGRGGLRRDLHGEERQALLRLLPPVQRALDDLTLDDVEHLRGVGVLAREGARAAGVDGPVARASELPDETPCDLAATTAGVREGLATGCTLARLRVRLDDARAALRHVDEHLRGLPDGPVAAAAHAVPDGVAHAVVRGPNGSWSVLAVVARGRFVRLRLRPPEVALLAALPAALVGVPVDHAAAVLTSFGLHDSALDR